MGTESCQEFTSLNQTIFSQAGKGNLAAACRDTGGDPSGECQQHSAPRKAGFLFCHCLLGKA